MDCWLTDWLTDWPAGLACLYVTLAQSFLIRADPSSRGVRLCVCVCHLVWSCAAVNPCSYSEVGWKNQERKKERKEKPINLHGTCTKLFAKTSHFRVHSLKSQNFIVIQITVSTNQDGRFRWPRGLRRGYAVARFLGLRVRIPQAAWMSVCCGCWVLSGSGMCVGHSQVPK